MTPELGDTFSAGESGDAIEDASAAAEIIIGEIPTAEDPTVMEWTARCTDRDHDLLGHFPSRPEAEAAGASHIESDHHRSGRP